MTARAAPAGPGYAVIVAIIVAVGAALVLATSFSGAKYAVTVSDVAAAPERYDGRHMRVVGRIKHGSARQVVAAGQPQVRFTVVDAAGHELHVTYPYAPPDAFEEGRECIVEGGLAGTTLTASKLTVKCPSKYQSEDGLVDRPREYYRQKYGPPRGGPSSPSP